MGLVTTAKWQRHSSFCHSGQTQTYTEHSPPHTHLKHAFFQWLVLLHYQTSSEGGMHTWVTTNCFEERKEKCPGLNAGHYRLLEHIKVSAKPVPPAVRWSVAHSMLLSCLRWHRCCLRNQSLKEIVQQRHCATHPTQGKEVASTQLKKVSCRNKYPWQGK